MSRPSSTAVEYLETPADAARFLDGIAGATGLAVDTEGASFHRFVDRIYLLQLTARVDGEERSAIIDPLSAGELPALGRLLESPDVEVVFHDADYDLRLLHQDYGWHPTRLFDTRIAAQLLGLKAFGLAALLEREFGLKLDKKHQRADWSMRPLTADMLDYAAQDTRWLLGLRDRLREQLAASGRTSWAAEEFARLEGTRWEPEDAATAFLRLKGARDLSRRELALLRELVQWRDGLAAELDRATFRVVGNEALFEIARRAPTTREALSTIRGVPRGSLEGRSQEMLAAVRRGLAVADAELPRFPRAPRWDRDPDFDPRVSRLRTVRENAAHRLALDPGVLCSRERLEAVARRNPASLDELQAMPELRRWQVEVLGPAMLQALRESGAATPTGGQTSDPTGDAAPSDAASGGAADDAADGAPDRAAEPSSAPSSTSDDQSPYRDG